MEAVKVWEGSISGYIWKPTVFPGGFIMYEGNKKVKVNTCSLIHAFYLILEEWSFHELT